MSFCLLPLGVGRIFLRERLAFQEFCYYHIISRVDVINAGPKVYARPTRLNHTIWIAHSIAKAGKEKAYVQNLSE